MKYLLDVNALLALGFSDHQFHVRMVTWMKSELPVEVLTCPISELGFVRVLAQNPDYPYSVTEARTLLINLKKSVNLSFIFIPDSSDISSLPAWAKAPEANYRWISPRIGQIEQGSPRNLRSENPRRLLHSLASSAGNACFHIYEKLEEPSPPAPPSTLRVLRASIF